MGRALRNQVEEYVGFEIAGSLGNSPLRRFDLGDLGNMKWDNPFQVDSISDEKRREIAKAAVSAAAYLQLVDAGKVRLTQSG
jgi:hypothetical protein